MKSRSTCGATASRAPTVKLRSRFGHLITGITLFIATASAAIVLSGLVGSVGVAPKVRVVGMVDPGCDTAPALRIQGHRPAKGGLAKCPQAAGS